MDARACATQQTAVKCGCGVCHQGRRFVVTDRVVSDCRGLDSSPFVPSQRMHWTNTALKLKCSEPIDHFPSRREMLLLPHVPVGTHQLGAGNPDATKPFPQNAVISAIVHCVGEVAHWNERSSLRRGVVAQGWLLRVSAHSIAHAECTLGSNREALLARLSSTVALLGFTASPLHPSAKAIAQVDATVYRCRFCHLGQSRASVQITLGSMGVVIRSMVHSKS
jgi:hypothetical protein